MFDHNANYFRTFHLMRCDPEGVGTFADVIVHGAGSARAYQDIDFSPDGRMYRRARR